MAAGGRLSYLRFMAGTEGRKAMLGVNSIRILCIKGLTLGMNMISLVAVK